jgi:hypothetical protein
MVQFGFIDADKRLSGLTAKGDPLVQNASAVNPLRGVRRAEDEGEELYGGPPCGAIEGLSRREGARRFGVAPQTEVLRRRQKRMRRDVRHFNR